MIGPDSSAAAVRTTLIKLSAARYIVRGHSLDKDEEPASTEIRRRQPQRVRVGAVVRISRRGHEYGKTRRSTSVCYYNTGGSIAVCLRATVQAIGRRRVLTVLCQCTTADTDAAAAAADADATQLPRDHVHRLWRADVRLINSCDAIGRTVDNKNNSSYTVTQHQ